MSKQQLATINERAAELDAVATQAAAAFMSPTQKMAMALQLADGKPFIRYPDTYCMCHATPEWIEQQIQTYQRLVRETSAKMLYVDQQATVQNIVSKTQCVCFHPGHGHPVPNHVNETDIRFIAACPAPAAGLRRGRRLTCVKMLQGRMGYLLGMKGRM